MRFKIETDLRDGTTPAALFMDGFAAAWDAKP